jgi:predicted glycoside hydrolase/deacetylase ChbG (UPF0249 family)
MRPNLKRLIVNGDDFGLSEGVNDGIITAHEQGILTSASLMVRWPSAEAAASYARRNPRLSVGLHLDLAEWTFKNENWELAYQVVPVDDASAVSAEIERQLGRFKEMLGREPSHLDAHQHVHETEPIRSLYLQAARKRKILLRNVESPVRYSGQFYGQSNKGYPYPEGISVIGLLDILRCIPEGVTELGCHPAKSVDMQGMYRNERLVECATLCHPDVLAAIKTEGISLCSFATWDQGELNTR